MSRWSVSVIGFGMGCRITHSNYVRGNVKIYFWQPPYSAVRSNHAYKGKAKVLHDAAFWFQPMGRNIEVFPNQVGEMKTNERWLF